MVSTLPHRPALPVRIVAAILCVAALAACTPEQIATYDRINAVRAEHGRAPLGSSHFAMAKAQAWAEHLASTERLAHSSLWDGMPEGGRSIAENVGKGADLDSIMAGFLASPAHRQNLLDTRWNWMGTGVARSASGTVYVVQVFALY